MAAYARVESVAGEQLKMVNPSNVRFIALPRMPYKDEQLRFSWDTP